MTTPPTPECICGEINARHCPVHNDVAPHHAKSDYDALAKENNELKILLEATRSSDIQERVIQELKAENEQLKRAGETWQGHAEANHALLMRAEEEREELKAAVAGFKEINSLQKTYLKAAEKHESVLKQKLHKAVVALETYAMTNDVFPEYGNVAREALAEFEKLKAGE
jgi:hypothetical protein